MTSYTSSVHGEVIQNSRFGFSPLLQSKLVNQLKWYHITGMSYFIFLKVWLSIRLYLGHYDPSGGKPPGQFFLCRHQDRMKLSKCIIKHSKYHGRSTKSCISATDQSILTSLLQGALRPKIMIVFTQNKVCDNNQIAGSRLIARLTWCWWILRRRFNLLLPTQWLEVNGGPVNLG